MSDNSVGWAWGDFKYVGALAVFESKEAVGGYKCKFCSTKLTKRWDVLRNHIKHCNKTFTAEDFKNLNNSITKVAIRCQYCKVPLNIIGKSKQDQHMKVCKARKVDMVQENKRQTLVLEETNPMVMGQADVVVDQTNVVTKVQANKEDKGDKENNVQENNDFWKRLKPRMQVTVNTLIEEIKDYHNNVVNKMKHENDLMEADLIQVKEGFDMLFRDNQNLKKQNEQLKEEIKLIVTNLSTGEKKVKKVDDLEEDRNKEKLVMMENLNGKLGCEVKKLTKKIKGLKNSIDNGCKLKSIDNKKMKNVIQIGEGTFGKVYKCEYEGEKIAVKKMNLHWTSLRELAILLKVNSKNLMRATMLGLNWNPSHVTKSVISIGMQLCDTDLHAFLNFKIIEKGDDKSWKFGIASGTALALKQLHKIPVIHKDIKPENFLLVNNTVKLADFGFAEFGTTGCGIFGTPGFIAPEVIESKDNGMSYTNKCDMWSLGVTLYRVFTEELLVKNTKNIEECLSPDEQWDKAGEDNKEYTVLCRKLLDKDPKKRTSAPDFESQLSEIIVKKN